MTAQSPDTFEHAGRKWEYIAQPGASISEPLYAMGEPRTRLILLSALGGCREGRERCFSTACTRGWVARFAVRDGRLFLSEFFSHYLMDELAPWKLRDEEFGFTYGNLDRLMSWSGSIQMGFARDHRYYVHLGWQYPYSFERVAELRFEGGMLVEEVDRTDEAMQLRRLWEECVAARRDSPEKAEIRRPSWVLPFRTAQNAASAAEGRE